MVWYDAIQSPSSQSCSLSVIGRPEDAPTCSRAPILCQG